VVGSRNSELSGSITGGEFLDLLSNNQLLFELWDSGYECLTVKYYASPWLRLCLRRLQLPPLSK
jgi:hypothetical protein